jgi:hypothetical protein
MMKRRDINIFGMAFIDCICCGLGAVILLFVLANAQKGEDARAATDGLAARLDRIQKSNVQDEGRLAALQKAFAQTTDQTNTTRQQADEILTMLEMKRREMVDRQNETLASKAHIAKLKADIRVLDQERKRLQAGAEREEEMGNRLLSFPGQGDRHYLTDLKMGGRYILILVDASASMLDDTVVGAIRWRNQTEAERLSAPKWRQVVATVEWLTAQLPPEAHFQVLAFNESAWTLVDGTEGTWLDAGNLDHLNQTVDHLRRLVPAEGTSLLNAFEAIGPLKPRPDNLFLLTDSLPTVGARRTARKRISAKRRLRLFNQALTALPKALPVNVILYPMEGDPSAASAFWRLAMETRGSYFCPSRDWP